MCHPHTLIQLQAHVTGLPPSLPPPPDRSVDAAARRTGVAATHAALQLRPAQLLQPQQSLEGAAAPGLQTKARACMQKIKDKYCFMS